MDPISREKVRVRRIYNDTAHRYDRLEAPMEWLLLGRLRRRLVAQARGRVLEVAAGTGRNLPLYPPDVHLTLCDISLGMLTHAAAAGRRLARNVPLVLADAERLPFADAAFDTVITSLSLCTVPDLVASLREMARVLRPGGEIRLLEHVLSDVRPVAFLQRLFNPLQVRHMGCHLDRDTTAFVRRAGLRILHRESHILGIFQIIFTAP